MENAEEVMQRLDEFSKLRPKTIPKELDDYLCYVARTGDPIYQWSLIKCLFKEKLLSVITDFYETSPGIDIPHCPNVDPFNYDVMKNSLIERIEGFASAPFTVQRICELLTTPRKNYNRIDKFMRAVEKNILVVSTREPGPPRQSESESSEHVDSILNGSENSEYNVDVEMEDLSWKESGLQAGSSDMAMIVESSIEEDKKDLTDQGEKEQKIIDSPSENHATHASLLETHPTIDDPILESIAVTDINMEQITSEQKVVVPVTQAVEAAPADLLIENNDSKPTIEQELDPLAIEDATTEDTAVKQSEEEITTVSKDPQPDEPLKISESTEVRQVDIDAPERVQSEGSSDSSSSSDHSNADSSSDDMIKSEIIVNVIKTPEKFSFSEESTDGVNSTSAKDDSTIDDKVIEPVENKALEIEPSKFINNKEPIESIADVIGSSAVVEVSEKENGLTAIQEDAETKVGEVQEDSLDKITTPKKFCLDDGIPSEAIPEKVEAPSE